jgi:hypothetical protein
MDERRPFRLALAPEAYIDRKAQALISQNGLHFSCRDFLRHVCFASP